MYIGSWPQNIGNAFFDLGARAVLMQAVPEATFFPMGGAVHWMFNASTRPATGGPVRSRLNKLFPASSRPTQENSLEIGEIAEVDLLVFAGMSMCREFVENNGRTFVEAAKRGVAVLGLGAGGALYDEDEGETFSTFFNGLGKSAVITRDDDTFDLFKERISNIWPGIDCAFFLPDFYTPPVLALPPYDIENFDYGVPKSAIDHEGRMVLHTHHDMWGLLPKRYTAKQKTLVSDVPEDYLTLYSQVSTTYADRVHACVATLAYGNKARLYSSTPRKALFDKVGVPQITREVASLDADRLQKLKLAQIRKTREFIEHLVGE